MSTGSFDLSSILAALMGKPVKLTEKLPEDIKEPVDKFHYNILVLCDTLKDIVSDAVKNEVKTTLTPSTIDAFMSFLSEMKAESKEKLISGFIKNSSKYWDDIHDKKDGFLTTGLVSIFTGSGVPENYVNDMAGLLSATYDTKEEKKKPLVTAEQMEDIWNNFHGNICLSIKHIYKKRAMVVEKYTNTEGKQAEKLVATVKYFPDIKVKSAVEKWKITL